VGAVLLGVGGQDALMLNPQPQPPDIELGEAVDPARGERDPVVGPDRLGEAEGPEGLLEDGAHPAPFRGAEPLTRQQVPRVLIGNRQRVAVDPVPGPELALEVGRPEIIRRAGRWRHDAGVLVRPAPPALLDQAPTRQQIARRADGRPRHAGIPRLQPVQELLRPPAWMGPPGGTDELGDIPGNPVRTVVRGAAPVLQAPPAFLREALEPFVAGLATDAVPRAQLGHRVQAALVIGDEAFTLVHG
jgi:hypothetical protein